ncbi:MAG TPA: hypothetical protein PK376_05670 [Bacteroidales bacterium]|nr:MAG: hypothetical protein BWX63_01187 [Bacteroidetes bacterium ADurb.Bin041]HPW43281.1 hypothetical protein [Bacteroidales bacterium]
MKRKGIYLLSIALFAMSSCDLLQQAEGARMLSTCEFKIQNLSDVRLAGVDVSGISNVSEINTLDVLAITNALLINNLPLTFNLNLLVKNPNQQPASMNRLDWILFIDDMQMLDGSVNERFVAEPQGVGLLPVKINFNLSEVLKGETKDKIINTAIGLVDGSGQSARVMIKLKPSIMVGQHTLMYPKWLEVKHEFTAK